LAAALALAACSGASTTGTGTGTGTAGAAGGTAGAAGTSGAAGTTGGAGTTGAAGSAGVAGSSGAAGTGTTGSAGTTGAAGTGTTGGAGGAVGGRGGAGGAGGRGGAAGTATAGSTGSAGTAGTGTAGRGGSGGGGGAAGTGGAVANACASGATGAYYLDSAAGNDASDGMTPATAWKTLAKINATTFQPGNEICLKAGGTWTGQLYPKGSGSSAAPIVIDMYGTGAKPIVAAGASDPDAVHLMNQQYWEINDLEVTNKKSAVGDYRGISINGQDGGTLNHIYVRNCFVHDVTGEVDWIGGDTANNMTGVTFQTGWDKSKHTGGIVFDVQAGTANVKTKFNDVLVESNTVQDCSFGGIIFKQLDGTVHWGTRSSATSASWFPHTNVTVRGNYVSQLNASLGCDAIYMTNVQNGLIEENVSNGAGTSAIELYYTDGVTVQKNETFGTKVKAGGTDSNGVDTDKATTKTIIQYNYFHDNGDGILICQFSFGDSVIRYNILQNNSRYQINLHSDPAASSAVYNNTIYNNKTNSGVVYGYGTSLMASYTLRNNIFFAASGNGVLTTASTVVYQNNLYAGSAIQTPAGDAAAVMADPKLAAPGTGTSGSAAGPAFGSLDGYKLGAGSPAINAGVSITGSGGMDFWGDAIVGMPDIGAYESH
jgi:hypothetical protein